MENMKTNEENIDPRWRTVVEMSGTLNNQDNTGLFFSKESSIFKNLEYIDQSVLNQFLARDFQSMNMNKISFSWKSEICVLDFSKQDRDLFGIIKSHFLNVYYGFYYSIISYSSLRKVEWKHFKQLIKNSFLFYDKKEV